MIDMKVILSAVGVAAVLASPVLAKTARHTAAQASTQTETRAPATQPVVMPYAADVSGRTSHGLNPDFQNSGDK